MYFGENNSNMLPDYFRDREHNITGSYFFLHFNIPAILRIYCFIYLLIYFFIYLIYSFVHAFVS